MNNDLLLVIIISTRILQLCTKVYTFSHNESQLGVVRIFGMVRLSSFRRGLATLDRDPVHRRREALALPVSGIIDELI